MLTRRLVPHDQRSKMDLSRRHLATGMCRTRTGRLSFVQRRWSLFLNHFDRQVVVFSLLCVVVAAVSVHDALLVVVNHEIIGQAEQNPVGRWLLEMQGGGRYGCSFW